MGQYSIKDLVGIVEAHRKCEDCDSCILYDMPDDCDEIVDKASEHIQNWLDDSKYPSLVTLEEEVDLEEEISYPEALKILLANEGCADISCSKCYISTLVEQYEVTCEEIVQASRHIVYSEVC